MPALFVLLGAFLKKVVDFVRYARAGDANGVVTQLLTWAAGFAILELYVHSDFGASFAVGGVVLANKGIATQLIASLAGSSGASVVLHDLLKAIDSSNSTLLPNLLDGKLPDVAGILTPVLATSEAIVAPPAKRSAARKRT